MKFRKQQKDRENAMKGNLNMIMDAGTQTDTKAYKNISVQSVIVKNNSDKIMQTEQTIAKDIQI